MPYKIGTGLLVEHELSLAEQGNIFSLGFLGNLSYVSVPFKIFGDNNTQEFSLFNQFHVFTIY